MRTTHLLVLSLLVHLVFPSGRPAVAGEAHPEAEAARRLIDAAQWEHGLPRRPTQGLAAAAARILDLWESGSIPRDHRSLEAAARVIVELPIAQGRLWEASRNLAALEAGTPDGAQRWKRLRELLFRAAGRDPDGMPLRPREGRDGDEQPWQQEAQGIHRSWNIEAELEVVLGPAGPIDAPRIHAVLLKAAESDDLVPIENGLFTSLWTRLDRELRAAAGATADVTPALIETLRIQQDRLAGAALRSLASDESLTAAYRRLPWSNGIHRAMLEAAERDLRRDRPGLARRVFEDVLSHSADPALRAEAQVGLWLALAASARDPGGLDAAFGNVPPGEQFPWMGSTAPASMIRDRLMRSIQAACAVHPIRLESLDPIALRIPPFHPWDPGRLSQFPADILPDPCGRLWPGGERCLLAGPGLLALFDGNGEDPLWFRTPQRNRTERRRESREARVIPGEFRPSIAAGRIYTRWGIFQGEPSAVACFDAQDGLLLWSTFGDPAWHGLAPAADPVVSEGRVYVPAVRTDVDFLCPASLVCLSEESGTILWQRSLGTYRTGVEQRQETRRLGGGEGDAARWGTAVRVDGGAVYVAMNLGFIARCDARDGRVEWLRPYPRFGPGMEISTRRLGTAPVLAGDAVVAAPRDRTGALALERETGALLWENPLLPSDEILGACGDLVILAGSRELVAAGARTGEVLWERTFQGDFIGRPFLAGREVFAGTPEGLERISAETGATLERRTWPSGERPEQFALLGNRMLTFGPGRVHPSRPEPSAGRIEGYLPLMWAPDPPPGEPEAVYILTAGVFRALDPAAPGTPRWARLVPFAVDDVLRMHQAAILVGPHRAAALDASSGTLLWEVSTHLRSPRWLAGEGVLFAFSPEDRRECTAFDPTSGAMLWHQDLGGGRISPAAFLDGALHLIADGPARGDRREGGITQIILDPATGEFVDERPILGIRPDEDLRVEIAGTSLFLFPRRRDPIEFDLLSGKALDRPAEGLDRHRIRRLRSAGAWLQVEAEREEREAERQQRAAWLFKAGDPSPPVRRNAWGTIQGNVLLETDRVSVRRLDLETGIETVHRPPVDPEPTEGAAGSVAFEARGVLRLLSSMRPGGDGYPGLRLDSFDVEIGRHMATERFPSVTLIPSEDEGEDRSSGEGRLAIAAGKTFWIAGSAGVDIIAPSGAPGEFRRSSLAPVLEAVRIDGRLDDWEDEPGIELAARGGGKATLHIAHHQGRLLLGLRFPGPPVSLPARLDLAPGCKFEIGISGSDSVRHLVDLGRPGITGWQTLGDPTPEGVEAAVRRDPATGNTVCELAVPLENLPIAQDGKRLIGVSLAIHDDRSAGLHTPRVAWGAGLAPGQLLHEAHEMIHLSRLRRRADTGLRALLDGAPHLPSVFNWFIEDARQGAASSGDLEAAFKAFLGRHPAAVTMPRLLAMDRALRLEDEPVPAAALAAAARAAGVSEALVARYETQAAAAVSQLAYLDGDQLPRSIQIGFFDGIEPTRRDRTVYWVKHHDESGPPIPRLAARFPPRAWQELAVPLSLLGLNDVPITGAWFTQQGPSRVVWGRTSVAIKGRDVPLFAFPIDGSSTGGHCAGGGTVCAAWKWIEESSFDGVPSHASPVPRERHDVVTHSISGIRPEVDRHVVYPTEVPAIRQEVFIDPARPPRSIALSLHDGRERGPLLVWGEKRYASRRMGPLPAPGVPAEIHVPIEWTGFAGRPFMGVAFGAEGGKVFWGLTTLVTGSKNAIIIDGPRSGGLPGPPPSEDLRGPALVCDGRTAVEEPDSAALEPETFTLEAWFLNREPLRGREKRRWIAGKTRHEQTAGHYALMIRGSQAGAYLNIAGKPEQPFQVWSEPGKVVEGRWHHMAMTYDGAQLVIYLDGEHEGAVEVHRERQPGEGPFVIGKRPDAYTWFRGLIDEVALYSRSLDPEEVRARFEARGAPACGAPADALVQGWSFDGVSRPAEGTAAALWENVPGFGGAAGAGAILHTHQPDGAYASHEITLAVPFVDALTFDRARAAEKVEAALPAIAGAPEARLVIGDALRLFPVEFERRAALCRSFVRAHPASRASAEVLGILFEACGACEAAVEPFLAEAEVSWDVAYAFRRRNVGRQGLSPGAWRMRDLGPGLGADAARITDAETASWRERVPVAGVLRIEDFQWPDPRVAYAACWVVSEDVREAVLEIDEGDCDIRAWVGDALVLDARDRVPSALPAAAASVTFSPGVHRILLEIGQGGPGAAFGLEVVDRSGRGPPQGVSMLPGPRR